MGGWRGLTLPKAHATLQPRRSRQGDGEEGQARHRVVTEDPGGDSLIHQVNDFGLSRADLVGRLFNRAPSG